MKKQQNNKVIEKAVFATVLDILKSILDTEYKVCDESGKPTEKVDYELTLRMMKSKARLALDFAKSFEN